MDIIKAEIARKRKLLEDQKLVGDDKKYFRRGDLLEKEREDYMQKYVTKDVQPSQLSYNDSTSTPSTSLKDSAEGIMNLPRSEVIRKLRERGEPIMLYGESEIDACCRLRQLEISAPEVNRGFRNDFQEAMEEVDQAYLQEILDEGAAGSHKDKNRNEDLELDESVTYESIQEKAGSLGKGNKKHDADVMLTLLKLILKMWSDQVNCGTIEVKMRTQNKITKATFMQTRVYLKPLLKKLKNATIPEDILESLTEIIKKLLEREYIKASDAYLTMAIGNAPWPIGVTMVGIHARTGREKIFSKNVAHVLNDETQRKYIQGLKRLMTKCQEFFPAAPSKSVEYVSHKDR